MNWPIIMKPEDHIQFILQAGNDIRRVNLFEKKVYNDFGQQPALKQSRIKLFFGSGKAIVNKFHSRLY